MNIKLDENLPEELVELLAARSHDVHTVRGEHLIGRDDPTIFRAAVFEKRLLITQDLDFSDVRKFAPGTHPGIVLVRLRDPSRRRLVERFWQVFASEDISSWTGCFIVISDKKLRIRRP